MLSHFTPPSETTQEVFRLDANGRCCRRKPLIYRTPAYYLFCDRCDRAYNPATGTQIANWAYVWSDGGFVRRASVGAR